MVPASEAAGMATSFASGTHAIWACRAVRNRSSSARAASTKTGLSWPASALYDTPLRSSHRTTGVASSHLITSLLAWSRGAAALSRACTVFTPPSVT